MPVESRHLGLRRNFLQAGEADGVMRDIDPMAGDAVPIEKGRRLVAPRAARFEIQNRQFFGGGDSLRSRGTGMNLHDVRGAWG